MYTFTEFTQEGDYATAYILTINGSHVDTVYQNIHTGAVHTHQGVDLSVYGLSL